MKIGREERTAIAVFAIIDLMLFSQLSTGTLLGMLVAAALVVLGLITYSRPTSVVGMLLASGSAAASLEGLSLTIVGDLLNIAIGLLIPVYLLAWVSFSAEVEPRQFMFRARPATLTAIFASACLLSVGAAALVLGLVVPAMSIGMSALMEIAIVLLVAAFGLILLTWKDVTVPIHAEGVAETEADVNEESP